MPRFGKEEMPLAVLHNKRRARTNLPFANGLGGGPQTFATWKLNARHIAILIESVKNAIHNHGLDIHWRKGMLRFVLPNHLGTRLVGCQLQQQILVAVSRNE